MESLITFLAPYKKIIYIIILCIAGLGVLLFILQGVDSCSFNRDINKKKEAVNNALQEAANIETNITVDKVIANQIQENVNQVIQEHQNAVNATDEQRERTNQAFEKWKNSQGQNKNVSAEELERILEGIQ